MSIGMTSDLIGGGYIDTGSVSAIDIDSVQNVTIPKLRVTTSLNVTGTATFSGGITGGVGNMQVFTSTGTFTVPAGVTKVKVTLIGGGGGGGGGNNCINAGGGGGGGAAIEIISGLTPAGTVTVTVGAGGTGGGVDAPGGTGGTSSFGAFCSATGGVGGAGATAGSTPGAGGIGSGGDLNIRGSGGTAYRGGGTLLAGESAANTTVASPYGGGGVGGDTITAGTTGAVGVVIVEY